MPLHEEKLAVAESREGRIVGDGDKGASILPGETKEEIDDRGTSGRVEVAGRFVGKEDARIVDERSCDGDALLLAAAQLRGKVIEPSRKTDPVQQSPRLLFTAFAADHGREHDVLERGQLG